MVSFSCENCGDVLTKKKLDPHRNQCRGASFTCLDCMVHFYGLDYRSHTSCISEAQKYQGALYRPEKEKKGRNQNNRSQGPGPHRAYVEDVADDSNAATPGQILPQAPSPSAAPAFHAGNNVFDYMVDSETPNASRVQVQTDTTRMIEDTPAQGASESALVEYNNGAEDAAFTTPAPRAKKSKDVKGEEKKDKKRKRPHVDVQEATSMEHVLRDGDEVMADAPPDLHSGLTGGLNRLSTRPSEFPPSPDYSGAEPADGEISPVAPTKKPKRSKKDKAKPISFTNGLLAMMAPKKPKKKKKKGGDSDRPSKRQQTAKSSQRMLEFKMEAADGEKQVVVYKHPAEHLMSFVTKGPDSEKGVSMNKALKRYHRERVLMGSELAKGEEEKELWRSLRLKQNDRGEIVMFF